MSLTRDNWERIIIPIVIAVILAPLGQFLLGRVRQADVRYGTGGAYLSSKLAVSSLGLKNWGYSDAEDVTINAVFADPLIDISAGPMGTHFDVGTGGIGQKTVTGTIKRLVSDENVYIYFITEPSSPWSEPQGQFIRGIKFNGGLGKTGLPILWTWVLPFLGASVLWGAIWIPLSLYWGRRQRIRYLSYLTGAIQRGHSARQEGVADEQLRTRVEEWYKTLRFFTRPRLETLMTCAQVAFEGANQSPTQTAGPMR